MRTPTELQEKIDFLTWFKHDLDYQFRITPLSAQKHAVASAFYRTIDNEIAALRWCLGQLENTWEDDLSQFIDLFSPLRQPPVTEYPHLPYNRTAREYWGRRPQIPCAYISGPDSPKDDQNFDFTTVHDSATWKRQSTTQRPKSQFLEASDQHPHLVAKSLGEYDQWRAQNPDWVLGMPWPPRSS